MDLYGFAEIDGADARTTFVRAGADLRWEGDRYAANVHISVRRGVVAAVFHARAQDGSWRLANAMAPAFEAVPIIGDQNGLIIVSGVELRKAGHAGPTCWKSGHDPRHLDDRRRRWWPRAVLPPRASVLPMPPKVRREGQNQSLHLAIVGRIGGDGRYHEIVSQIEAASAADRSIVLTIDSEGGDTSAGMAIYRALASHSCRVEAQIARAESIACILALAADIRHVTPDASMMLHQTSLATPHNASAADLRRIAGDMENMHRDFAGIVASATGGGFNAAESWIERETRFTAGQAVRAGLAHSVMHDVPAIIPSHPRARFTAISGPFRSVKPATAAAALYAINGRYRAGQTVRHNSKSYVAVRATFGAVGLSPDRNRTDWEEIDA